MNDDFLKQYRKRPEPHFSENLYQQLENKPKRTFPMLSQKLKLISMFAVVLLLAGILTFSFSTGARAALLDFFTSFNGVDISIDLENDKIVTSGNTDAIIYQDDNSVLIEGPSEGEMAEFGYLDVDSETVSIAELEAQFPDFTIPTQLPQGYTLDGEAAVLRNDLAIVTWRNAAGDTISLQYGAKLPLPSPPGLPDELAELEVVTEMMEGYTLVPGPDGAAVAILTLEKDGNFYQVVATDKTISEADLMEIIP